MALTKSTVTLLASTSNAAGATTNGSWIDVAGAYEGTIYIKATNGGTGPTIGLTATVERADDGSGTNPLMLTSILHEIGNNAAAVFPIRLPEGCRYLRVSGTGNTGQAVTIAATLDKVTAL